MLVACGCGGIIEGLLGMAGLASLGLTTVLVWLRAKVGGWRW